jgi:hypothetical protein
MPKSISKIYVTEHSSFRLAFQNSDSFCLLSFLTFNEIHIDRFNTKKTENDYFRTKLEIDLNENNRVILDFLNGFSDDSDYLDDAGNLLPKMIELDGYKPIVLILNDENEAIKYTPVKHDNQKETSVDRQIFNEFCQFYKIRPFMTTFKQNSKSIKSNLIYFKETTESLYKKTLLTEINTNNISCSSCLLIWLYRHVHRRLDFYSFVRHHLPSCFLNLHFNTAKMQILEEDSNTNKAERDNYMKSIEENFRFYWKELECEKITGIESVLSENRNYYGINLSDETLEGYESIRKKCIELNKDLELEIEQVASTMDDQTKLSTSSSSSSSWHTVYVPRICAKNLIDSKSDKDLIADNNYVKLSLLKLLSKTTQNLDSSKSPSRLAIAIFCFFLISLSSMVMIILNFRYKRTRRTCLRLKINRGGSGGGILGFQRLESSRKNVSKANSIIIQEDNESNQNSNPQFNNQHSNNSNNLGESSYDAYEYDDEFEINSHHNQIHNDEGDDLRHMMNNEDDMNDLKTASTPIKSHKKKNYSALNEEEEEDDGDDFKIIQDSNSLNSVTNNTLMHIKKIKQNLLSNRDSLLKNGLLSNFTKIKRYSNSYSYHSADANLVAQQQNEFELKSDHVANNRILATYDSDKKRPSFSVSVSKVSNNNKNDCDGGGCLDDMDLANCLVEMHVSMNPLDMIERVENKRLDLKMDTLVTRNESDA